MKKVIIAAASENNVIGKDKDIPWHFPKDMKHFKQKTMGYPVVMGSSTYRSLPKDYRPLPRRLNIVLTRSGIEESGKESVREASSLEDAWNIAEETGKEKVFVAGGGKVYEQCMDLADKIVFTRVKRKVEDGDVFFPEINDKKWRLVSSEEHDELVFEEYVRK